MGGCGISSVTEPLRIASTRTRIALLALSRSAAFAFSKKTAITALPTSRGSDKASSAALNSCCNCEYGVSSRAKRMRWRYWAAVSMRPRLLEANDVVPFTSAEIVRIITACDEIGRAKYERLRARAMVLLMRCAGCATATEDGAA